MSGFTIILRSDSGLTKEGEFDTLKECAEFAGRFPEYGISLYGEFEQSEWQRELDNVFQ